MKTLNNVKMSVPQNKRTNAVNSNHNSGDFYFVVRI